MRREVSGEPVKGHGVRRTHGSVPSRDADLTPDYLHHFIDAMDEGFAIIEMLYDEEGNAIDHRFVFVNASFEATSGLKDVVGRTSLEINPDLERTWHLAYEKVIQTGIPARLETLSDALGRTFKVYASRYGDPENHQLAIMFTDITEQRRTQLTADEAVRELTNVLDTMGDAFFKVDSDWKIVMVNKKFEETVHKKRGGYVGKDFWTNFPSTLDVTQLYGKYYHEVMRTRKPKLFVDYYEPLDVWTEVRAYPTDDGGMTVFFNNVTAQHLAEEELAEVTKRSNDLELEKRNLSQQRRQLVTLNKAKDEFIGTASHQLRTPATAVKQYVSLLKDGFAGDLNRQQQEFADKAYTSNERQLAIINDLLKTAQLDANRYEMQRKRVKVADLIDKLRDDMAGTIEPRRQKLLIDNEAPDVHVQLDEVEMNLVLVNLVENASKYSPERSTISIIVQETEQDCVISVMDEGVGIAEADQKRVFEKFTRVDNEFSDTVNGSGLGLYMAHRIVTLHHGMLTLRSSVGEGSSFTISLPRSR